MILNGTYKNAMNITETIFPSMRVANKGKEVDWNDQRETKAEDCTGEGSDPQNDGHAHDLKNSK